MKLVLLIVILLQISACSSRIYGIHEEQWLQLSPTERKDAIEHHQQMEILREQRYIEEAKVAVEREKQQLLEMEQRQVHIEQIYSGERGIRGDLLRVTIRKGSLYINGKHRHYSPVSFRIADGEKKLITFHHPQKHHYQIDIPVEYIDGVLSFDYDSDTDYDYRHTLAYEPVWRRGKYYKGISLHKHSPSQARNIEIIIEAVPLPKRY